MPDRETNALVAIAPDLRHDVWILTIFFSIAEMQQWQLCHHTIKIALQAAWEQSVARGRGARRITDNAGSWGRRKFQGSQPARRAGAYNACSCHSVETSYAHLLLPSYCAGLSYAWRVIFQIYSSMYTRLHDFLICYAKHLDLFGIFNSLSLMNILKSLKHQCFTKIWPNILLFSLWA